MKRTKPVKHAREYNRSIPVKLPRKYTRIYIFADIFYVNGNKFLHTTSSDIKYRSVQYLKSRKATEIADGLKILKWKYEVRVIYIMSWHMDNKFYVEQINQSISPATMDWEKNM